MSEPTKVATLMVITGIDLTLKDLEKRLKEEDSEFQKIGLERAVMLLKLAKDLAYEREIGPHPYRPSYFLIRAAHDILDKRYPVTITGLAMLIQMTQLFRVEGLSEV